LTTRRRRRFDAFTTSNPIIKNIIQQYITYMEKSSFASCKTIFVDLMALFSEINLKKTLFEYKICACFI
jgi:hypothetical protein